MAGYKPCRDISIRFLCFSVEKILVLEHIIFIVFESIAIYSTLETTTFLFIYIVRQILSVSVSFV